jgi:hypothetical protein
MLIPLEFDNVGEVKATINIPFNVSNIVLKSVLVYDFHPELTTGTGGIVLLRSSLVPFEIIHGYAIPSVVSPGSIDDVYNYTVMSQQDVTFKLDQATIRSDYYFRLTRINNDALVLTNGTDNVHVQIVLTLEFLNIL